MLSKEAYQKLKKQYGDVASWAIWKEPGDTPKSNTSDLTVFEDQDLLEKLNPNYVFVGFNGSSTHGQRVDGRTTWANFHSEYCKQQDYRLRYALIGTEYWGSYITDLFKNLLEVDSVKFGQFLRQHPEIVTEQIEDFKNEMSFFDKKPVLVAMHTKTYNYLKKYLESEGFKIVQIPHYSYWSISKEEYRIRVLESLAGKKG